MPRPNNPRPTAHSKRVSVHPGVHALLSFVCAASNPRIARLDLDGGVALVTLTSGLEFSAYFSDGGHGWGFDMVNESDDAWRWLARNRAVLAHEVDRELIRRGRGEDIGAYREAV